MSKTNEPPLTTHTYDGIQEYDNPMPGWWSFLFIACVVWGVVYWIAITVDLLPTYETEFAAEMEIQRKLEEAAKANLPPITPQMLAEAQGDEAVAAHGAEVFAMHCATCHGKLGEGQIGPNLTDTAWIVGDDSLASIHKTVQRGTPNGMPQWGSIFPNRTSWASWSSRSRCKARIRQTPNRHRA